MLQIDQAKTLFQLQSELMEAKVDIAVNKSINQVVEQIVSLRHEMHREISGLRHEMHREISGVKDEIGVLTKDMSAVKERLGMRTGTRNIIWTNLINYGFHGGWLIAVAVVSYVLGHTHTLFP